MPTILQVWRGLYPVSARLPLTLLSVVGASPGGEYIYLSPSSGVTGNHVVVLREVPLSYHFYLPLLPRAGY